MARSEERVIGIGWTGPGETQVYRAIPGQPDPPILVGSFPQGSFIEPPLEIPENGSLILAVANMDRKTWKGDQPGR